MSENGGTDRGMPRLRGGRGLKAAFVISLALNLLVVGAVASAAWIYWQGGWGGGRHQAFVRAVEKLMHELPEDRRHFARDVLERHRSEVRPLRRRMRQVRRAAADALEAEPYDEPRLRKALAALKGARDEIRTSVRELALAFVKHLSQDERSRFLRYMTRGRWRRANRRDRE